MIFRFIFAAALAIGAAAQGQSPPPFAKTYLIGTPTDGCTGGLPLTIAGSNQTVRYGTFSCSIPVDGFADLYIVKMEFLEPCWTVGSCAGGQVTLPGQRVQNVLANDAPILMGFDPFAAGATDISTASRQSLAYSIKGKIVLRMQTVTRSAVLASVTVWRAIEMTTGSPYPVPVLSGLDAAKPVDCINNLMFYGATDTNAVYWCYENVWRQLAGVTWVIK